MRRAGPLAVAIVAAALLAVPSARANHSTTELTSVAQNGNDDFAFFAQSAISQDGSRAFIQTREPLVAEDTDNQVDLYERSGGVTRQVSTGPSGGNGAYHVYFTNSQQSHAGSDTWPISADGRHVFFQTYEALVSEDTDSCFHYSDPPGCLDLYERFGGTTKLVSMGPTGGNGNSNVMGGLPTPDGSRVFFATEESLVTEDTDGLPDRYERSGGTTKLVTPSNCKYCGLVRISDDGEHLVWSTSDRLVPEDTDSAADVYETFHGETRLVSTGPSGGNGEVQANARAISPDGSRIIFETTESLVPEDSEGNDVYERSNGTTTLLTPGVGWSFFRGASEDASHVFFETFTSVSSGDTDTQEDLYESAGGTIRLVSTGPVDGPGDADPNFAGSSADGSRVLFTTPEQLVSADTDSSVDIYERFDGNTTVVSTGPNGGNGQFVEPDVNFLAASADGRRVFFSTAESLVSSDADVGKGCTDEGFEIPCYDVYERFAGTTTLVSTGPASQSDGLHAVFEDTSRDGTRVLFRTAEVLTSDDHDAVPDDYVAGIASTNGYARPKGATPIQASLVPAYAQCASPNREHGPPLGFGSCNPPSPASQYLTVGTADSNEQPTRFIGSVRFVALPDNPATSADEADVRVEVVASDVRSSPSLADYTGELSTAVSLRITDRDSSPGGPAPSTVQEMPFSVAVPCTSNADSMEGSACGITTSADTLVPGMVRPAQRAIWELGQIKVYDGGSDGLASTGGNTLFAVQGVFVP